MGRKHDSDTYGPSGRKSRGGGGQRSHIFLMLGLTAFPLVCGTGKAALASTENVFLVILEGLRNTEALEDTSRRFIPRIWNDLVPLGTRYSSFYNTVLTLDAPSHNTILTGCRQYVPQWPDGEYHSQEPTVFEYYRKALGIPLGEVRFFANRGNLLAGCDFSYHPDYGAAYRAGGWTGWGKDSLLSQRLYTAMDSLHPSLVVVTFGDIDDAAHSYGPPPAPDSVAWERYTAAIASADSLVLDLWKKIEADSLWNPTYTDTFYRGRTTLMVTADHGRHDDEHGGFREHNDWCAGCRRMMFLAVGPEVKPDTVVETVAGQVDICPTIGTLLGFETPFCEGKPLSEMLLSPADELAHSGRIRRLYTMPVVRAGNIRLTQTSGTSRNPAVGVDDSGIHVVWMESVDASPSEGWEVDYRRSTDTGLTWSQDTVLFPPTGNMVYTHAAIGGSGSSGLYVPVSHYRKYRYPSNLDSSYQWYTGGKAWQEGIGWSSWDQLIPLNSDVVHLGGVPAVSVEGSLLSVVSSSILSGARTLLAQSASTDGGETWSNQFLDPPPVDASRKDPDAFLAGGVVHLVWVAVRPYSDVLYHSDGDTVKPVSASTGRILNPMIHGSGDFLVITWGDTRSGAFEVYVSRSTDGGYSWSAGIPISGAGGGGAWRPDVVAKGDTVVLVWEDYRSGDAEVFCRVSTDQAVTWSAEIRLTESPGYSCRPRVAESNGKACVVWQDRRDGNWEVYAAILDLRTVGADADLEGNMSGESEACIRARPSPFLRSVTFSCDADPFGVNCVQIYNLLGQRVATIPWGTPVVGKFEVSWDGRGRQGAPVPAGVYFWRLEQIDGSKKTSQVRRVVKLD